MINLNEKENKEKCYYCDRSGDYWDYSQYKIISVCRYHLTIDAS
jgi:hypothetical protein